MHLTLGRCVCRFAALVDDGILIKLVRSQLACFDQASYLL